MPKPDALDVAVSAALLTLTMIVAPVLVGRSATPHVQGEPQRLHATILTEQRYIAQARQTLALCAGIEAYLSDLPPAEQAFDASVQLQDRVDAADRAWTVWEATAPPGRFSTLHEKLLALVNLSRYLAGEAWAYYGDLDEAHLADVGRGLAEAARERERLEALLQALDFEPPPTGQLDQPDDGPLVPEASVAEWEEAR